MAIAITGPDLTAAVTVSIGAITDFSKLKGMGKLALLYAIALFVITVHSLCCGPVFHHGMMLPPV